MRYYPLIQSAPFIFLLALKDNAQQLLNIQINNIKVNFCGLLVKNYNNTGFNKYFIYIK